MRNILLKLKYDGRGYHGWQIQDNAITVQSDFQKALFRVLGEEPDIKGCSRTDAGVHANMFCISFHTAHAIPAERLPAALNRFLPSTIAVYEASEVADDFHARYSCLGKEYVYKIHNAEFRDPFLEGYALHYWHRLDHEKMARAAGYFIGRHDFTSFCTADPVRQKGDFHRTVSHALVERNGDMVFFRVRADGFLYNMVRIMVGTLLYTAQGKLKPEDIPGIILSKDRKKAGPTAPPQGLYLDRVFY